MRFRNLIFLNIWYLHSTCTSASDGLQLGSLDRFPYNRPRETKWTINLYSRRRPNLKTQEKTTRIITKALSLLPNVYEWALYH